MFLALDILGSLALAAWVYLVLFHGQPASFPFLPASQRPTTPARIVAVIPARNEAQHIYDAVKSVLTQEGVVIAQLIVVDDGSTDDTDAVARRAAISCGRANQSMVIQGAPLPAGWSGKVWAMHQGTEAARRFATEFLWFTDADVVHAPGVAAGLADLAESGYDMVSAMVELRCATPAEKLLIPAFVYFFFQLYPPKWIADPKRATAGAAGGCILIWRRALDEAGGLPAISSDIIDDCALAAKVKRSGGKVRLGATRDSRSLRGYDTFAGVGRMIARSAFHQLKHSAPILLGTIVGMLLLYVLPVALLFTFNTALTALGAATLLLMFISYLPSVRAYRRNALWAFTLPVAAVFYMGATIYSAFQYWSGKGGEWKGRNQDVATRS